ncbi:MAG: hypothetical protein II797_03605 [Clostridia bacterium]|nr:hypothetical protein [Clostridia bacterium]
MKKTSRKIPLSFISLMHYIRLTYRSLIFILLLLLYILYRIRGGQTVEELIESQPGALFFIWLLFVVEMALRFFPSKMESPGCQKQFSGNYIKTGKTEISIQDNHGVMLTALIWVSFNALLGVFHMIGLLDDGIMILLCSFYSVCDMICILFFCPFQSWILKNKCCCTCRIYNWDYAMMFTPLFFVRKVYTLSLLALSVALLARWEITFYLHPERFSESTNGYLSCANCQEKLCSHKNQLKTLWKQIADYTQERIRKLKK